MSGTHASGERSDPDVREGREVLLLGKGRGSHRFHRDDDNGLPCCNAAHQSPDGWERIPRVYADRISSPCRICFAAEVRQQEADDA